MLDIFCCSLVCSATRTTIMYVVVVAQIPDQYQIKCRLCRNAVTLDDCSTQVICDNRTEASRRTYVDLP